MELKKLEGLGFKGLKYSKVSSIKVLRRKIDEREELNVVRVMELLSSITRLQEFTPKPVKLRAL